MVDRPGAYELIAGVTADATFGPVILFGQGGTAVEIVGDKSLELPPLNTALARAQIERTRIAALLKGYRDRPAADIDGVVNVLMQLSQIVADHAEIAELDINPLLCDAAGVIAVDAPHPREGGERAGAGAPRHPALSAAFRERGADARGRSATPCGRSSRRTSRRCAASPTKSTTAISGIRFFAPLRERTHETAARLSQIDYDREMTLVAWDGARVAGLARATADPDFEAAECAVIIRADLREKGLARQLLEALFKRDRGAGRAPRGDALSDGAGAHSHASPRSSVSRSRRKTASCGR